MPTEDLLINFIQIAWSDIHHSRMQEWTALGVIAGAHLGMTQIEKIPISTTEVISANALLGITALIGAVFVALGILLTCRHRHLMRVKLNWIFQAEQKLKLIRDEDNPNGIIPIEDSPKDKHPWEGLALPRPLSTGGLIIGFYLLLLSIDIFLFLNAFFPE